MESIFSVVFTSALVSTIVNFAITAWSERRAVRKQTRFDALKAAVVLEGYAIECFNSGEKHKLAFESDGHAGELLNKVPEIPTIQIVSGFLQPKKAAVADKLMKFPQELLQENQSIEFCWDIAEHEMALDAALKSVSKMGIEALDIALELREIFKLPTRRLVIGTHDIKAILTERIGDKT